MKFTVQDQKTLDPAVLSAELITAFGTNYGISTAGTEITTNGMPEPDQAAFQTVLDAHVANAVSRELDRLKVKEVKIVQALHALALTPSGTATLYNDVMVWINTQPLAVQIDFNKRDTFRIEHPAIQAFKTAKGWTDAQLQELFTLASTL